MAAAQRAADEARGAVAGAARNLGEASRKAVKHVEFNNSSPVDVLIDGEIFSLVCKSLDVIPSAVDFYI